ncbi:MAG: hypothetical protein PHQ12_14685 [Chthoniobacteraceae bacterium]|nr:hypothetical protein [Chthoniobacteraceae bacterium]
MNAEYALKVIDLVRHEANIVAGVGYDSHFGKSGLTVDALEAIEDRIEEHLQRPMVGTESVTVEGDRLAHEIKERYFASIPI